MKFTDEQYTIINQSTAGWFDSRVFVNCLQVEKCHDFTLIRVCFRVRAEVKMEWMEMKSRGEGSCTRSPVSTVTQGNQRES